MPERWMFMTTDGHNYMIPEGMREIFIKLDEQGYEDDWCDFNNTFDEYRIDSMTNWTFENPKEDA